MELDTRAVIGRLNLSLRPREALGPSTYNISRLGLAPDLLASSKSSPELSPQDWPVVVADPAFPPPTAQASPISIVSGGARRKTSFTLPAELLEQVRAHATATGTYQYAVVSQALQWFFRPPSGGPPVVPGGCSVGGLLRRLLARLVRRRGIDVH